MPMTIEMNKKAAGTKKLYKAYLLLNKFYLIPTNSFRSIFNRWAFAIKQAI
jgi:hypothetical protein